MKVRPHIPVILLMNLAFTGFPPGLRAAAPGSSASDDRIVFGDSVSESAHHFVEKSSDIGRGGAGLSARRLLPTGSKDGGSVTFSLAVDPAAQNYFTIKLWGSDAGIEHGRLILSCEGKQVGYRDQGEIDALDIISDAPRLPGHFFYTTVPLPLSLTQGKQSVSLTILAIGVIWPYGNNADNYRHVLKMPSRGMYAAYSRTDPYFADTTSDPATDPQRHPAPAGPPPPTRPNEGDVLGTLKSTVNGYLDGLMRDTSALSEYRAETLAHAYGIGWTSVHGSKQTVGKVVQSLDELMRRTNRREETFVNPKNIPNDWFGYGPAGWAIAQLSTQIQPILDQQIDDGLGHKIPRRQGWSKMLVDSRDYWRQHRRSFTNQTMIVDLNLYRCNRGIEAIDPPSALPESQARRYLYEDLALLPWTGSDVMGLEGRLIADPAASAPGVTPYYVFTRKGLSKELGFVGGYGEILDWAQEIYRSTEVDGQNGDPKLHERLKDLLRARSFFREPAVDEKGFRAMRLEQVVGWRDHDFPGIVTYAMPTRSEGSSIAIAATLGDPTAAGYVTQMLEDRQFFPEIARSLDKPDYRTLRMLLDVPDDYAAVLKLPQSSIRLPMSPGSADLAFADEDDGVLALKHGNEILYAELYYRAQMAINHRGRVHYLAPGEERDATVVVQETFTPSGSTYKVPDLINRPVAPTPWDKPAGVSTDRAGEEEPIAATPSGVIVNFGNQNPFSGRAQFYTLRYGRYMIGMNASPDKSYAMRAPQGIESAPDLISGKTITLDGPVSVPPHSTVVLYLPD